MGSINLKHTGSGSAIALSSDGTSLLLDGTAIGGGGADLYAANESSPTAQPSATGTNAIAIGDSATATAAHDVAIGLNANATAQSNSPALAMGKDADASSGGISIGNYGSATGTYATALGTSANATATNASALGNDAKSTASDAVALGKSRAAGTNSFAAGIANNTTSYGASSSNGVSIGPFSQAITGQNTISIGYASIGSGGNSSAVGYRTQATNTNAVALGSHARATGYYSLAISSATGDSSGALSSGIGAIAIGRTVTASHQDSAVLGNDVQSTATNQVSIGGSTQDVRISETYTLPKVDGTASGQVLTTNGSGVVSWATAGGGADLYAANESGPSAQPSATGANAVAIGESSTSSGTNSFSFGTNTTASGIDSFAMGYNAIANSLQAVALGSYARGSGTAAVALGKSYASGEDSFAAVIDNNSTSYGATGANSIAIGKQAKSTGNNNVAIGQAQALGSDYTIAIGYQAKSTAHSTIAIGREAGLAGMGDESIAIGFGTTSASKALSLGRNCSATGSYSVAIGAYANTGGIQGKFAFSVDYMNQAGDAQQGKYILHCSTTDATATGVTSTGSSPNSGNQVNLPNNSCYGFTGTVIAREDSSATNDFAVWEIKGGAVRAANAGTTALGTYNINKISESAGATNWSIALSADTTNGAVAITVTGEASHNIRWVATVNTAEVIY